MSGTPEDTLDLVEMNHHDSKHPGWPGMCSCGHFDCRTLAVVTLARAQQKALRQVDAALAAHYWTVSADEPTTAIFGSPESALSDDAEDVRLVLAWQDVRSALTGVKEPVS